VDRIPNFVQIVVVYSKYARSGSSRPERLKYNARNRDETGARKRDHLETNSQLLFV
jgi:hypothetical protein